MRKVLSGTPEESTIKAAPSCRFVVCVCRKFQSKNVITDCPQITVSAIRFPHQRETVFYACSPCDRADKIHLVSVLLEHLTGIANPPIQIVHDPLGRPKLLLSECDGPAVSFSECGGKLWAALCSDTPDIGIDAAGTDEFSKEYPFGRVFHIEELQQALQLTGGDLKKASALLWSVKEAAVKSLGCAFHLVDPLQICVSSSAVEKDGRHSFTVSLLGKALERFPMLAGRHIVVRSLFLEDMWLSVALLNR
jgi:phosphopantetheinyl transferase